ncbi:MAG: PhoX family protein [Pseudomonadales bacterium]|nr:PhoX family protein [Pseudomonadales bacterium]
MNNLKFAVGALALAVAQGVSAGSEPYFTPLTSSAVVGSANDANEVNSPFVTPAGVTISNLTSLQEAESKVLNSVQRVPGLGAGASMFDMLAFDIVGKFIYIPHETYMGAGLSRYNMQKDKVELLFAGDQRGPSENDWSNDFGAFDPARFTPNKTIWLAEEWSGLGRVVEVMDPWMYAPEDPTSGKDTAWRVLDSIPRVSHEGIAFSKQDWNKTIYFVDEDRSGSIYKMVLNNKGDYAAGGQVFVLVVDTFVAEGGDPAQRFDRAPNIGLTRTGVATWVPITDENGNDLPGVTNPYNNSETSSSRPGRVSADDVDGTPYGRPEDVEVSKLANGNEVLYFAATSEQTVYSVEMTSDTTANVRVFASEFSTPKNVGFDNTTGVLNSPDNLAQDALGNIYIIEDAPNRSDTGGDTWFVRDTDNDGVAESIDHFLSLGVRGAEATGMIFNPTKPLEFVIAVQHPASTDLDNVPGGFGDAIWNVKIDGAELDQDILKAIEKAGRW